MKENQFGKKLRELRKEKGLSQKDLGELLNVCNQAVSFWETGSREPDLDTLRDIAKYFDTSVDYLLGREIEKYPRVFSSCPTFQERLPILCQQLHVTKYRLQKETGIAESAIYSWQSGTSSPSLENVLKIADTFDCSVDFILGRSSF